MQSMPKVDMRIANAPILAADFIFNMARNDSGIHLPYNAIA